MYIYISEPTWTGISVYQTVCNIDLLPDIGRICSHSSRRLTVKQRQILTNVTLCHKLAARKSKELLCFGVKICACLKVFTSTPALWLSLISFSWCLSIYCAVLLSTPQSVPWQPPLKWDANRWKRKGIKVFSEGVDSEGKGRRDNISSLCSRSVLKTIYCC